MTDDYDDWYVSEHGKRTRKRLDEVVPAVEFKVRVLAGTVDGSDVYRWDKLTSYDLFGGKRVIIFSLPGAFTPTCDTFQLPGFELMFHNFRLLHNIDAIYCISVNDAFVMNAWAKSQDIQNVIMIPDGNTTFTQKMGMLVDKENIGFGARSWRYAAIVDQGRIEVWFEEPGFSNNAEDDPYGETTPEKVMEYLNTKAIEKERG
jgi:peroxiredoxin